MIKAVETIVTLASVRSTSSLRNLHNRPLIFGKLEDSGDTMVIEVNKKEKAHYLRIAGLWYVQYTSPNYQLTFTHIGNASVADGYVTYNDDDPQPTADSTVFRFDISNVRFMPKSLFRSAEDGSVAIDMFTAESNIKSADGTIIFGSQRIVAPFKVASYPTDSVNANTDGWYQLGIADIRIAVIGSNTISFKEGDIVMWVNDLTVGGIRNGYLKVAKKDTNSYAEGDWEDVDHTALLKYLLLFNSMDLTSADMVLGVDVLVTYYLKFQKYAKLLNKAIALNDNHLAKQLFRYNARLEEIVHQVKRGMTAQSITELDKISESMDALLNNEAFKVSSKITANYQADE